MALSGSARHNSTANRADASLVERLAMLWLAWFGVYMATGAFAMMQHRTGFFAGTVDLVQWGWFELVFLNIPLQLVLALAALQVFTTTPLYRATATIQVDPEESNVLPYRDISSAPRQLQRGEYLWTQAEKLRSRGLVRRVVSKMDLGNNEAFTEPVRRGLLRDLPHARPGGVGVGADDPRQACLKRFGPSAAHLEFDGLAGPQRQPVRVADQGYHGETPVRRFGAETQMNNRQVPTRRSRD